MIGQRYGQTDVASLDHERRNLAGYVETDYHRPWLSVDTAHNPGPLTVGALGSGWPYWTCLPTGASFVYKVFPVKEKWIKGVVSAVFYWFPDDNTAGNVVWRAGFSLAAAGTVLSATVQTNTFATVAAPGAADQLVVSETVASFPLTRDSDVLLVEAGRVGSGANDTYAANTLLIGVRLIFRDAEGGVS